MRENDKTNKIHTSVADFYEQYGSSFAETRGGTWNVLKEITTFVRPGDVVVDVGAGNGRLVSVLPSDVVYLGVEPSRSLREASASIIASHTNARMIAGGFPSLPVPDETADVTTCIAVLHHLSESERATAIDELLRITKPGGIVAVTVMNIHGRRWMGLRTWLAAWLRLPMVAEGGPGDVWIPWKRDGKPAQRFFHAFTRSELRRFVPPARASILLCDYRDDHGIANVLQGKNILCVFQKKTPHSSPEQRGEGVQGMI